MMKKSLKERAKPTWKTISPEDSEDPLMPNTRKGS